MSDGIFDYRSEPALTSTAGSQLTGAFTACRRLSSLTAKGASRTNKSAR